jgi:hypothetical protein
MTRLLALFIALLLPTAAHSQVEGRQVSPEEKAAIERADLSRSSGEVQSPMLLEIPLIGASGENIFRYGDQVIEFESTDTSKFVCDKATVPVVRLRVGKATKDSKAIPAVASMTIRSGWLRQYVNVTLALIDANGTKIAHKYWDDLTIGNGSKMNNFAGGQRSLILSTSLNQEQFSAIVEDPRPTKLQLLVEIRD